MTKPSIPDTFIQWKRALIGGSLSALVTGIPMFISYFFELQSTNTLLSIFLKSFTLPGLIISLPLQYLYRPADMPLFFILLSLLYWFFFGFGLSLFIKDNVRAIGWWFLLVLISLTVIVLLINSMAGGFQ